MARVKIDYGIDLGTTNSAISRMENGMVVIKKSDTQKDTIPSCVYINKKQAFQAGDTAFNARKQDKRQAVRSWDGFKSNAFVEFKRTMGTDKAYYGDNLGKNLSSEELSAEILKALRSFVKDEAVSAAVITIPAAFKNNQIDATRRAAKLAGLQYVEVLQEPVAAAIAYGLEVKNNDGYWLVFDFGGGTFDAALIRTDEGIMKVVDTEGDNYLGGKNLDEAIVDGIILPYFESHYAIDSILEDDAKKQIFRDLMKYYAEEAKIALSFSNEHNILSDLGDIPAEDDNGEELELDIVVTNDEMKRVLSPIFQKAIDISLELLKRNNLLGNQLQELILVGGPTLSPVLREMLSEQIKTPNVSVDPMTVVSRGAALYASTMDVSDDIKEQNRDLSKVQLDLQYEATTVELEEFVAVKLLQDGTESFGENQIFVEFLRDDKAWSTGKLLINTTGDVVDVQLNAGRNNNFEILVYDGKGDRLECQPSNFSIIQGIGGVGELQTLPYNYGVEIKDKKSNKIVFSQIQGLERNKSLPVVGIKNGLRTQKVIAKGTDDFIKIPLYQGEHGADGTRAIYNEHIYDIKISGRDLPATLPENSDVDLTIKIDKSQKVSVQAYFPYLDYSTEIAVPSDTVQSIETNWLENELNKAKNALEQVEYDVSYSKDLRILGNEIEQIEEKFYNNPNSVDTKQEVVNNLRKTLKKVDALSDKSEWSVLEADTEDLLRRFDLAQEELGNDETARQLATFKQNFERIKVSQDVKMGRMLYEEINRVFFSLTIIYQTIGLIKEMDEEFYSIDWKDRVTARKLLDEAMALMINDINNPAIMQIVRHLLSLLPDDDKRSLGDETILMG